MCTRGFIHIQACRYLYICSNTQVYTYVSTHSSTMYTYILYCNIYILYIHLCVYKNMYLLFLDNTITNMPFLQFLRNESFLNVYTKYIYCNIKYKYIRFIAAEFQIAKAGSKLNPPSRVPAEIPPRARCSQRGHLDEPGVRRPRSSHLLGLRSHW